MENQSNKYIRRLKSTINFHIISIIVSFLIWSFLSGCSSPEWDQQNKVNKPVDISVKKVVGNGRIEPELKIVGLTSEVNGIIKTVHAQAGDTVEKNQIIIEMKHAIEQAKVDQAMARIETQKSAVQSSQASLDFVQIKMKNARTRWKRIKQLYEKGAENQANYDNATAEYQTALAEVERLEAQFKGAQNVLKQYKVDLVLAQKQLAQKMITAPADGQVLSLDVTIGSAVTAGKPIGNFAPQSTLTAWCEIDEIFADQVKPGQHAYIRPEGMEDTLAVGKVIFTGPYLRKKSLFSDDAGTLEDRRVREVRIHITPETSVLFGQRVECVILLQKVEGK